MREVLCGCDSRIRIFVFVSVPPIKPPRPEGIIGLRHSNRDFSAARTLPNRVRTRTCGGGGGLLCNGQRDHPKPLAVSVVDGPRIVVGITGKRRGVYTVALLDPVTRRL